MVHAMSAARAPSASRDRARERVERARRDESADERGTRGGATSSGVSGRRRARERGG